MPCFRLESERLLLRPPEPQDVPSIVAGIGDYEVARNLSRAPHPYGEDDARQFLGRMEEGRAKGTDFNFAILRKYLGDRFPGFLLYQRINFKILLSQPFSQYFPHRTFSHPHKTY